MFKNIDLYISRLNNSKYFAGIMVLLLNISSKYITIEISDSHKELIKHTIGRQILVFSMIFMATRDIYISLAMTAVFVVLADFLLNDKSNMCILPNDYKNNNNNNGQKCECGRDLPKSKQESKQESKPLPQHQPRPLPDLDYFK